MSKIRDAVSTLEDLVSLFMSGNERSKARRAINTINDELNEIENELGAIISEYESQIDAAKKLKDKIY